MIIITGATGQLGRAVVQQLLARVPAAQIGVSVRDPQKAHDFTAQGVRVRQGDFEDPSSLAHAFEGASQVLIVSSNTSGEHALRHHRAAIAMAKQSGAQRIFYTSHMGSSLTSPFAPMRDHAATEALLEESGVAFTSLRNGFYTASAMMFLGNAVQTGELALPEDGPVSWTTHADLAEATAIALSQDVLNGISPALTSSEAIDFTGIAALASEFAQRPIRRTVISDQAYADSLIARGVPKEAANLLLGCFQASRQGDFSRVDPTLARLVQRSPISIGHVLKATISPEQ